MDETDIYVYEHRHNRYVLPSDRKKVTPWIMFIIFVLGPCEPLIPLLSYPAADHSIAGIVILISVFTLITLLTMAGMVLMGFYGLSFFKTSFMEKYAHVMGAAMIFLCGSGMLWMGW